MTLPPMTRTHINDVPVYVSDIRTAFTGTLIFGVGIRDESARTAGTAHLVEHLVMSRVGKVSIAHNATTAEESLSFYAQGAPDLVADYLSRVARAVSTLDQVTDEEVAAQRRIIAAELGDDDELPGRGPLLTRFGARTLGLLDLGAPAHRSLSRDDALAFAGSWLHAGNAAVTFTGEVPPGFILELPAAGPVPERPVAEILPHRQTGWIVDGSIPLSVSMLLGPAEAAPMAVAASLIADALQSELRTKRQLIYSVSPLLAATSPENRFVAYALDPRPEQAVATAAESLRLLRDLAQNGPDEEHLREELERWRHSSTDPAEQSGALENKVVAVLRGRLSPDDLGHADVESVTTDHVRAIVAAAMPSLFVTFAEGDRSEQDPEITERLGLPASLHPRAFVSELSKRQLVLHLAKPGTTLFSPKLFRGLGGWNIAIDPERATYILPAEPPIDLAFEDVALASYSERTNTWNLVSYDGLGMGIALDLWRNSGALHRLLRSRVPAAAQVGIES